MVAGQEVDGSFILATRRVSNLPTSLFWRPDQMRDFKVIGSIPDGWVLRVKTFKFEAECPQCKTFILVVGYKTKDFKPQFAKHMKGKQRKNGHCWGSGLPVHNHHPKRESIAVAGKA